MPEVYTIWNNDLQFTSSIDNQKIYLDNTSKSLNSNGVSPKKLLLTALTGCTGMDVVAILNRKMKVRFTDFSVSAKASTTDQHPRIYDTIHLKYSIKIFSENDKEKVAEAVRQSTELYCGVHAMLSKCSKISHSIEFL